MESSTSRNFRLRNSPNSDAAAYPVPVEYVQWPGECPSSTGNASKSSVRAAELAVDESGKAANNDVELTGFPFTKQILK